MNDNEDKKDKELVDKLMRASSAVYLACPKHVADSISELLKDAASRLKELAGH